MDLGRVSPTTILQGALPLVACGVFWWGCARRDWVNTRPTLVWAFMGLCFLLALPILLPFAIVLAVLFSVLFAFLGVVYGWMKVFGRA